MAFDVQKIRQDFPALSQSVHGKPLVYLDMAATAQKPQPVVDAIAQYYRHDTANVHRSNHSLGGRATAAYESVREQVRAFINARSTKEVIFLRGTTEAINLVASSFGRSQFQPGDEVIISAMEHHANIVPWQMLRDEIGIVIKVIPMNEHAELDLTTYKSLFSPKTKLVAFAHISNALGTINPAKEIVAIAHSHQVPVLVDGAQSVVHGAVDVQDLDCDFFAFSGHKMYGPTGIGVLYAKEALLDKMPPYQGGGDMIEHVSFEKTTYNELPYKFEAGTPNISGTIGLGAAILYMQTLGLDSIRDYERKLLHYATEKLTKFPGLRIVGAAKHKAPLISFVLDCAHASDVATLLDRYGVAVRAGHHCAMPALAQFNVPATVRVSFALYNTFEEIDALIDALYKVKQLIEGAS